MPLFKTRIFASAALALPLLLAACGGQPKAADSGTSANSAPSAAEPAPAAAPVEEAKPVAYADLKGDAAKGKVVFAQCKSCHSAEPGKNMIGPSLAGVVGRKAATIEGFAYSTAMQKSGFTWDEETLFHYLKSPMKDVPGTKMSFAGLSDPQKRADVIAYLKAPN